MAGASAALAALGFVKTHGVALQLSSAISVAGLSVSN